jgi:hypothetical protein
MKNRTFYWSVRLAAFMLIPSLGMFLLELRIQEDRLHQISKIGYDKLVVDHTLLYLATTAMLGALPVFVTLLSVWLHIVADRLQVNVAAGNRDQSKLLDSILSSEEPFVLLLRSFHHDSSTVFSGYNQAMTFERVLIAHLDHVGRFVAVGRPGEQLPPVGATRLYFPNHEWQGRIKQLLAKASLVAIIMGGTEALLWEIEQSITTLSPEKLLLFFRLSSKRDKRIQIGEAQAVSGVLKRTTGHILRNLTENDVLVWFAHNWRPSIESSPSKKHAFDRIKAVLSALPEDRHSLRSTLSKHKFMWKYGHIQNILVGLVLFIALALLRVSYELF